MIAPASARMIFIGAVTTLLAGCLFGIVLTGPVLVRIPDVELDVDVSRSRMHADIVRLCGPLAPRDIDHPDALDRTADWIATELGAAGYDVVRRPFELDGVELTNVLASRPGHDPDAGTVVIGAHYDSVPGSPGADDNASGVAVLLELARTLPPGSTARGLVFAAFAAGEPPDGPIERTGAYHVAAELAGSSADVRLMISLDSVGYYVDRAGSQGLPWPGMRLLYPDRGTFVAVLGDFASGRAIREVKLGLLSAGELPVYSFRCSPRLAPTDLSDHRAFRAFGFPAVHVTDTGFMRHPQLHRAGDTPDRLDEERMAALVRALHGVVRAEPRD